MINNTGLFQTLLQVDGAMSDLQQIKASIRDNISYPHNTIQTSHMIFLVKAYKDVIAHPSVRYTLVTILALLTTLALTGNILVIIVIRRRKSLCRNPAIIFIFNLAICELISCLLYRPMLIMDLILPFTSHKMELYHQVHVCRAAMLLQTWFAGVGFHTIVAISQERLCLIVYPLKAKVWFSSGRSKKVLAIIWLISAGIVCPIPLFFAKLVIAQVDGVTMAYCGLFEFNKTGLAYFSTLFVLYFAIPSVILVVTYSKIFTTLYRRSSNLALVSGNKGNAKQMKSRRSLAKMMLAVAIIFSTCWGPNFAFFLHLAMGGKVPSNGFFLVTMVEILPLISSTINPVLYTINSRTFRTSFKDLFCCRDRHKFRAEDSVMRTFNFQRDRNADESWMLSSFATRSKSSVCSSGSNRIRSNQRFGTGSGRFIAKCVKPGKLLSKDIKMNGNDCSDTKRKSSDVQTTASDDTFVCECSPPKSLRRMENIGEVSE